MSKPTNTMSLRLEKFIPAPPEHVFDAWTNPERLKKWWGPKGVDCLSAELDLRVGGQYRIANRLPDGTVLWISGVYEVIERPHLLVFSWTVENAAPTTERVSIRFEHRGVGTNVLLTHEQIASKALSEQHQQGWIGCFDGLVEHLA